MICPKSGSVLLKPLLLRKTVMVSGIGHVRFRLGEGGYAVNSRFLCRPDGAYWMRGRYRLQILRPDGAGVNRHIRHSHIPIFVIPIFPYSSFSYSSFSLLTCGFSLPTCGLHVVSTCLHVVSTCLCIVRYRPFSA